MARKHLKFWNGRPLGKFLRNDNYKSAHMYVAAYSRAEAQRLIDKIGCVGRNEIKEYYSECWGTTMDTVVPYDSGVWVVYKDKSNNTQILEIDFNTFNPNDRN